MAIQKGIEGQNELKKLIEKYPSSKAIKDCATVDYNELVNSFSSSLREIVEDPDSANYDAKVAGDGPQTCESDLVDEKIVNDPSISTLNNEMYFLSTIAFLATSHLNE
uniref:Uncharacterized protein LOC101491585 n=2 Tax=Cicer arietinum TaxID=3827 RepID=A0A1S2YGL8_CICAR|nr:uncharacterized protein LOC101491585 [Cicer arietinum]